MATESKSQPNDAITSMHTHVLENLLTQPASDMFDMLTQPASTTMFGSALHTSWYSDWIWPCVFVDGLDTPTTPTTPKTSTQPTTPTKHLNLLS
jgi:hypothetical protein